ncbi:hypothetical protein FKM82_012957 [Ascaphus truei]
MKDSAPRTLCSGTITWKLTIVDLLCLEAAEGTAIVLKPGRSASGGVRAGRSHPRGGDNVLRRTTHEEERRMHFFVYGSHINWFQGITSCLGGMKGMEFHHQHVHVGLLHWRVKERLREIQEELTYFNFMRRYKAMHILWCTVMMPSDNYLC